jgi:hypothetical protein
MSISALCASIRVARETVLQSVKRLAHGKEIIFVERDRILDSETAREVAVQLERQAARSPNGIVSLEAFRAATGLGRNGAVMLLEYFDRARFTHRVATGRRVLRGATTAFTKSSLSRASKINGCN